MIKLPQASKILVRSTNWVGDAIMTTPALRAIRRSYPQARITLLAKPWVLPVFEHNDCLDSLMTYQADDRHRGVSGLLRLAADLKKERFDMAVLFQNAFEAALIAWLARIPNRIGFSTDGRSLLLTHPIHHWRRLKSGHFIDYCLGVVAGVGVSLDGRQLSLTISPVERQEARNQIQHLFRAPHGLIVGLNPGAAYGTAKRWPIDRYIALGRHLIKTYDTRILIFGAANEAAVGQELCDGIGAAAHNLAGRTSLRQAIALIGISSLLVTNDSGLMHVAAALNTPQVVIIGPTDPVATGPVNSASCLVQARHACPKSPCLLPHCPTDHRCMTAVSEEDVFQAACRLLTLRPEQ